MSGRPGLRCARLVEPYSLVLGIGANIGAHTLHLAKLVGTTGRVIAFEPTDFAFRKLCRNLELNPGLTTRVAPCHCFLTARDGDRMPNAVYASWPLMREAGLRAKHLGREMRTEAERGASLEELLSCFTPHGYVFYDERTFKPLPSAPRELQRMIAGGAGINAVARVD